MSEDNKTKFGNMPLGMINKMLVSFIGEDAFLDYCEKYHKDWKLDWQSREAFRKHLDRLFEEKESFYRDLNPHYEQSVYRIAFKILDDFCNKYGLPRYIADTILDFYDLLLLRLRLSGTEYPVFETYYTLDSVIRGFLHIFFEIDEMGTNNDADFSYRDAETKYNMVFDELGKKFKEKNGEKSSLEKFYTKLSNWYAGKINKNVLSDHFKKIIVNNCKNGQNPAKWKDMQAILDFCKKEDKKTEMSHLIEAYLTANVQNFIVEIQEENWKEIGFCFEYIEKNVSNKTGLLYEFHQRLFNPLGDKSEPINLACLEILEKYVYLKDEKRAEDLIANIEKTVPKASGFYCNWLHAYIAVAKGEFKMAKELYSEAFKNIHFAGIYAKDFLTQACVLSIFCDSNPDAVRNSIDPEKDSKTPLPKDAKRFAEYGHAIGVFDVPAEEAYLEYLYREDYFNKIFPPEMRFSKIKISSRGMQPNVFICEDKEKVEKEYIRLSKLNKKNINTQLLMLDAKGGQRRPPLSLAIMMFFCYSDTRFLDLVEKWLGLSDPETAIKELKFNIPADLGETPFNAATMVYRAFCLNNNAPDAPEKKRLKKITTHILDKTNKEYLGIITQRRFVHPLHNLIDSGDTELVRKTLEKFVEYGLDIDNEKNPNLYHNRDGKWENLKSPNTFLHRCIQHEAWNVLEMFLTEFKEKAAETIKKYNNSGKYAPFVFFFEKNKEKRTGFMEKFIKLFESCGVDLTIIPTDKFK